MTLTAGGSAGGGLGFQSVTTALRLLNSMNIKSYFLEVMRIRACGH
jgi:hypothetical protein